MTIIAMVYILTIFSTCFVRWFAANKSALSAEMPILVPRTICRST